MAKHYIIMSSSYTDGTRIALDITEDTLLNSERIRSIIDDIKSSCDKDVPLSTHFIETDSISWQSVKDYDSFFEGVENVKTVTEFAQKVKSGRTLRGLDVANYILSKVKCTHLSLEKLVYFAYADYLCSYSEKLFEDKIYAFTHGPVIDSVYDTYRRSGYDYVRPVSDIHNEQSFHHSVKELPAKSRILFAINGVQKLQSIDRTLEKYKNFSAIELVELTHRQGAPWSYVDSSKPYQTISDDLIRTFHYMESVD